MEAPARGEAVVDKVIKNVFVSVVPGDGPQQAEGSTDGCAVGSSTAPSRSFVFLETLGACLLGWAAGELQGGAVFNCVGQARRRSRPAKAGGDELQGSGGGGENWEMALDVKGKGGVGVVEPGRGEALNEGGQDWEGGGERGGWGELG